MGALFFLERRRDLWQANCRVLDHSQKSRQKNKESRKNKFSLIGRQTVIMRMGPDGIIKTVDILKKR